MKKLVPWVAILVAYLALSLSIHPLADALDSLLIGKEVVRRLPSRDRRLEALVMTKDGGATTQVVYHIGVVRAGEHCLWDADTAFIADHIYKTPDVRWDGDRLVIRVPTSAWVRRRLPSVRGVSVVYIER